MNNRGAAANSLVLLVVEDDEDDWEFMTNALVEVGANRVSFVHNGQELLDYLRRQGPHAGRSGRENPNLVILDLKMPKMDGAEALIEIRADPFLRRLPVVVLTTSTSEDEVNASYELGANSVISKPSSFSELVEILRAVRAYWAFVNLPTSTPMRESLSKSLEMAHPAYSIEPLTPRRPFSRLMGMRADPRRTPRSVDRPGELG